MTTTFLSNERRYAIRCVLWLHDLCLGQKKLWAGDWATTLLQFYDPQSSHKACINAAVKCSKKVKYTLVQPPETKKPSRAPLQNDTCNCHIALPSPEHCRLLGTSASLLVVSASEKGWPASELVQGYFNKLAVSQLAQESLVRTSLSCAS